MPKNQNHHKRVIQENDIVVTSPVGKGAVNPGEEFVILDEDPITDERILQDSVFAKIRKSAFIVVANFEKYLGRAAVLEMGYAIAHGIQILTVDDVDDPNLAPYCRRLSDVFSSFNAELKIEVPSL